MVNFVREEIKIRKAALHTVDVSTGQLVLSDVEMDCRTQEEDFIRNHIYRLASSDEIKSCHFKEGSQVGEIVKGWREDTFLQSSQRMASHLYTIMYQNVAIASADFMVVLYMVEGESFLALLKMNFRDSYTHQIFKEDGEIQNRMIRERTMLPGENQKLSEAALIDLQDHRIQVIEKKYEINGLKINYFSSMFLQCEASPSQKEKLNILAWAVKAVQQKYYNDSEQLKERMDTKNIIYQELQEKGSIDVPSVVEKIFRGKPEMLKEVQEKVERYGTYGLSVKPQNPGTVKKYTRQRLLTDSGIEIVIPMEAYDSQKDITIQENADGSWTAVIQCGSFKIIE